MKIERYISRPVTIDKLVEAGLPFVDGVWMGHGHFQMYDYPEMDLVLIKYWKYREDYVSV